MREGDGSLLSHTIPFLFLPFVPHPSFRVTWSLTQPVPPSLTSSLFLVCSSPLSSVTRESMERSGQGRDEPRENRGEGHAVRSILSLPSSLSLHSFHGMPTAPFGHSVAHSGLVTSLRSIPHLSITHFLCLSLPLRQQKRRGETQPHPALVVHSELTQDGKRTEGKERDKEKREEIGCVGLISCLSHTHTHTVHSFIHSLALSLFTMSSNRNHRAITYRERNEGKVHSLSLSLFSES